MYDSIYNDRLGAPPFQEVQQTLCAPILEQAKMMELTTAQAMKFGHLEGVPQPDPYGDLRSPP